MREIFKEVGLLIRTMKNQDGLVLGEALLREAVDLQRAVRVLTIDAHPAAEVKQAVDAAYDKPDHASIWLEWSSSVREEVWPRYTRLLDKMMALITPRLQAAMDNGEIKSVLSAQDLARSLTGFGYVMMQMINQPQRPSREEVTDFLFKYVTAPIQAS